MPGLGAAGRAPGAAWGQQRKRCEVACILQGLISNEQCCLNNFLRGRTLLCLTEHLAN